MKTQTLERPLKETLRTTQACWAAWVTRSTTWELRAAYRLSKKGRLALLALLGDFNIHAWLSGALTGGHGRSRALRGDAGLACTKLYVFPRKGSSEMLLIGANELDAAAQRTWRTLATSNLGEDAHTASSPLELQLSYDVPGSFERILKSVVQLMPCQGAWLAIRSGDALTVKAQFNAPQALRTEFSLDDYPLLMQARANMPVTLARSGKPEWGLIPHIGFKPGTRAWMGLALRIGKRQIGLIGFWREKAFVAADIRRLEVLAGQLASSVEIAITFSEVADHLRRMALLNEFALTVSSTLDLDQIVQRAFGLLVRAFRADQLALFLLSTSDLVRKYSLQAGRFNAENLFLADHPLAKMIISEEAIRVADLGINSGKAIALSADSISSIAIPLKYRGQLIGTIYLESKKESAYSAYDEHLLLLIAGYLAGLVENSRLREEAEARARNLGLIHEVVQQVLGLTDIVEMAQIAAELMAKNFVYELALVMLADEEGRLSIRGVGGTAAQVVHPGLANLEDLDQPSVVNHVFKTGKRVVANDVTHESLFVPIPGWDAGSEMCVPLREGGRIIGILDVESQHKNAFSPNDLLALESLAGILASVVANAGQYQQLQNTVLELQETQQELQARIGALKDAESRLVQAAKLAAVGEMSAGVAHELNNPLTTVVGFTELVMDELPDDSPHKKDLDLALREARRARTVVRRLLDFSRQSETVRVRTDMNEVVTDVLALMRHLMMTSNVNIVMNFQRDLPWISVDRNQMKQVMLNLFHNALNAMPKEGGEITITTRLIKQYDSGWLTISINDTGQGIPQENLNRIFEPFFTTRSGTGGTGLGLSVTYGIVTEHGGKIEVESQVGGGSTFTVWLPEEI
jgi:signal transduction histidine kinase